MIYTRFGSPVRILGRAGTGNKNDHQDSWIVERIEDGKRYRMDPLAGELKADGGQPEIEAAMAEATANV